MKNKLLTFILVLSSALLTNCAKSSDKSAPVVATTTAAVSGSCTAGYVNTGIGCLPQGNCPSGYGYYNNQCYPVTAATTTSCQAGYIKTAIGCLPQNTCPTGYGYSYGSYNGQTGGWCYPQTN